MIFTVGNALGGEPTNLSTTNKRVVVIDYRDSTQRAQITDWTVVWKVRNDTNDLLDAGELAQITVPRHSHLGCQYAICARDQAAYRRRAEYPTHHAGLSQPGERPSVTCSRSGQQPNTLS